MKNSYLVFFASILLLSGLESGLGLVFAEVNPIRNSITRNNIIDKGRISNGVKGLADGRRKVRIGRVLTAGNRNISRARILSRVRSRAGELFDPATSAEDAKRIAELSGVEYSYYNTAIVDNKLELTFVVVERNIVRSIVFVGNSKYRAGALRGKLDLKTGDYLDVVLAEAGRKTLAEFYREKGFAFVEVRLDGGKLRAGRLIYTIDEGPRVKTTAVELSGNNSIKTKALKKAIKTAKRRWFFLPGYYTQKKVAEDVTRLRNIYQRKGFLDTGVAAKWQFNRDKSKVRITFAIDEGPVYTVERVVLTGNEHFDAKRLRAELRLEQGQAYSEQRANSDVGHLLELYRENGFIDAKVWHSRKFISRGGVEVEFEVGEGERFRIGRINIMGNEQTQDKVIRRVLDEYDFQPGRWYNADTARGDGRGELERRIQKMVLTERGGATITASGAVPGQRDAQVSIIEGQTGMVMLGAGGASDSGLIGQMVFEQRNFDISDWPESFGEFITGQAFKGAGQSLRIALEPGTEVSEYLLSFSEPYFRDKPIVLDVTGSSWKRGRESYDEGRVKGYVGFEKRYKNRWRRNIGIRIEDVEVDSIDTDAPKEIKLVKGDSFLAGVRFGIGRDRIDDIFNPSSGYSFNASYEQVGGEYTFGVLSGTYRWYKTVYEDLAERKTILVTKIAGATVLGDAPPFEKFYAGGSGFYGIRGFDYRGVSTRGLQTNVAEPEREDQIGSDWVFLANAEVIVPLAGENLGALFFVDSGAIDSGNYRLAIGAGIQILIPQWFGPVPMRFELAAPVMKEDDDDTQVFSFSVGRLF